MIKQIIVTVLVVVFVEILANLFYRKSAWDLFRRLKDKPGFYDELTREVYCEDHCMGPCEALQVVDCLISHYSETEIQIILKKVAKAIGEK